MEFSEKTGPVSVKAETRKEAHDNERDNDARKSEAKNVAHVVSRDSSSGSIRGQRVGLRPGYRMVAHRVLLGWAASPEGRPATSLNMDTGKVIYKRCVYRELSLAKVECKTHKHALELDLACKLRVECEEWLNTMSADGT